MIEWMNNSSAKISMDVVGSLFLSRSGTRHIPRMFSHKRSHTFIEISLSLWRKAACKQTNLLNFKFPVYIFFFWIKNETIIYLWLILDSGSVLLEKSAVGLRHNPSGLSSSAEISFTNTTPGLRALNRK